MKAQSSICLFVRRWTSTSASSSAMWRRSTSGKRLARLPGSELVFVQRLHSRLDIEVIDHCFVVFELCYFWWPLPYTMCVDRTYWLIRYRSFFDAWFVVGVQTCFCMFGLTCVSKSRFKVWNRLTPNMRRRRNHEAVVFGPLSTDLPQTRWYCISLQCSRSGLTM